MKAFKISTLIKTILGLFCCMLLIVLCFFFFMVKTARDNFSDSQVTIQSQRLMINMNDGLDRAWGELNLVRNHDIINDKEREAILVSVRKELKHADGYLNDFTNIKRTNKATSAAAQIVSNKFKNLTESYEKEARILEVTKRLGDTISERFEHEYDQALDNYMSLSEAKTHTLVNDFDETVTSSKYICLTFLIIALAMSYYALVFLQRRVFDRLVLASTALHEMKMGNLSYEFPIGARNEIGLMLESLQDTQYSLINMIQSITNVSSKLRINSSEIDSSSQSLAARTEEQASALQETAASMEEIKTTVSNNAENAQQANDVAYKARLKAENGSTVISDVIATMDKMSQSARKISEISSVIDGIANQTNILALNAAVEAARAGEQGRGFTVVATEVRNLAKRSADAAKEISILINESVDNADNGAKLIENAGSTMHEIVASVVHVSDIMKEITQASEEQSHGVSQVATAVNEMDLATQQNAIMVEESSNIASNMNENAQALFALVAGFRVEPGNDDPVHDSV